MAVERIHSWREYDEAVGAVAGGRAATTSAHASLVFRGLARSSYSNRASLARLGDGFPRLDITQRVLIPGLDGSPRGCGGTTARSPSRARLVKVTCSHDGHDT